MPQCQSCLQQTCRKHPLQDHGERELQLKYQLDSMRTTSKQNYTNLIKAQIEKLKGEASEGSTEDDLAYRAQMEAERNKAEKRKRKKLSSAHERLARETGLHGSVITAMLDDSDNEVDDEVGVKRRKKEKKEKKESKKKDKKERKKSSKKKKSKKSRSRRSNSSSSSDSSSNGDASSDCSR